MHPSSTRAQLPLPTSARALPSTPCCTCLSGHRLASRCFGHASGKSLSQVVITSLLLADEAHLRREVVSYGSIKHLARFRNALETPAGGQRMRLSRWANHFKLDSGQCRKELGWSLLVPTCIWRASCWLRLPHPSPLQKRRPTAATCPGHEHSHVLEGTNMQWNFGKYVWTRTYRASPRYCLLSQHEVARK